MQYWFECDIGSNKMSIRIILIAYLNQFFFKNDTDKLKQNFFKTSRNINAARLVKLNKRGIA